MIIELFIQSVQAIQTGLWPVTNDTEAQLRDESEHDQKMQEDKDLKENLCDEYHSWSRDEMYTKHLK